MTSTDPIAGGEHGSPHPLPAGSPPPGPGRFASLVSTVLLALLPACSPGSDPAAEVVERSIAAHGGDAFHEIAIAFDFRGDEFTLVREEGRFHYERTARDDQGRRIREILDNDGARLLVDGDPVSLDPGERDALETRVNSVIYFGFLPFRLDDPAVRPRDLGSTELDGRTYRVVEVTFRQDGGGRDWEDRFVYWIDDERGTLDFLAYRFHTGEGGTRFRRAVNRREVGGILVQDWENFTADPEIADIAEYEQWYREGRLVPVSEVRLENVRVFPPSEFAG